MAKKVSQIKDAEVIEDTTKVTPEVEEQVSEEIVKTAKIVVGVTAVGLAVLGLKKLIGGSEEDLDVIDGEFVEQELISSDYETTEVESFEE